MFIVYYDTSKNTKIWAILDVKNKQYWDVRIFHSLKFIKIVFQLHVFTNWNQVNTHEAWPMYVTVCYFPSWIFVFYYWSDGLPHTLQLCCQAILKFGDSKSVSPKLWPFQHLNWGSGMKTIIISDHQENTRIP